jgi:hypothetical protein
MTLWHRFIPVLREPLIQFLMIGAILFAANHYFTVQRDDPRQIFIDPERVSWLVDVFQQGQGRLPTQKEVDELIGKWTQNEIFYREAQALGLDQGDEMMRSRLILKMRNILLNRVAADAPKEEELKQWFELNRADFDIPPRYTFEQFPLHDIDSAEDADRLAQTLIDQQPPSEYANNLRSYPRRPASNIESLFGEKGRNALLAAPLGHWSAVQTKHSWHLARITENHPAIPAEFDSVRVRVAQNFKKIAIDLELAEMASEIADKYQLHVDYDKSDLQQIMARAEENFTPEKLSATSRTAKARAGITNQQVN